MGKWKHRLSNINESTRTAICSNCGPVKVGKVRDGFWRCRIVMNETARIAEYRRKWGVSPPDAKVHCYICDGTTKIAYDHSHNSGFFRGWLCMKCNTALGLVNDDKELLRKMIVYLEK